MKIKPLTKEQLIISTDRLTRFKDTETKYLRVFKEIILNNLIEPKFKKTQLDEMDYEEIKYFAETIINSSLPENNNDFSINRRLYDYENSIFILNDNTKKLLKNNINYQGILNLLPENIPNNLNILKSETYGIKKIILCEGITEEILLPAFAKVCGCDFKENGIYVISAGGKNQVVKYFYKYAESLKIPIFVLLDNDAVENLNEIQPKLRQIDKIHLLKSGEFEDLLPDNLIKKTLNYATKNISLAFDTDISDYPRKVGFLEDFFKHRGLHEFKKAEFAELVRLNISGLEDVSSEIKEIINELSTSFQVH